MKLLSCLVLALLLAGCRVDPSPDVATETPVEGVDELVGPTVELGMVPTVARNEVALTASANAAGGLCLDEDDGRVPICFPGASLVDDGRPEIVSATWDAGQACVYALAPLDVTTLSVVDADSDDLLTGLDLLEGSEELGQHIFVGCYEDESPPAPQKLTTDPV